MKHSLTLLQARACGGNVGVGTYIVALELAIQSRATDAEHLPCHNFIAVHLLENSLDSSPFYVLEIV